MVQYYGRRIMYTVFFILMVYVVIELTVGPHIQVSITQFSGTVIEKNIEKQLLRIQPIEKLTEKTGRRINALSYFLTDKYTELLDDIDVGDYVEVTEKRSKSVLLGFTTDSSSELLSVSKNKK